MYKSSLRHIHDPVLLSLKMKDTRLLFTLRQTTIDAETCFIKHIVKFNLIAADTRKQIRRASRK
jgi:hypothetical protein